MSRARPHQHSPRHAFAHLNPRVREGLSILSRRSMLKAGLAGLAGPSLPLLLRLRSQAADAPAPRRKAVILLWMTGSIRSSDKTSTA